MGIRVPVLRALARQYRETALDEARLLLMSPYHEERMLSLFFLVNMFKRGEDAIQTKIFRLYLDNTRYVNSWDLVDTTAEHIVGAFLKTRDRRPLYNLAGSPFLWDRRISIVSTFHFIKGNDFEDTLNLSGILVHDKEDLIHKAVGWMLREVGKRDPNAEEAFLVAHYKKMPRTMLRYAIEKFTEKRRQMYLKGTL